MRPRRIRKLLSTALALILLGTAWFYLAPTQLGGSSTYVVTHGTSMEPRFHTGDLAIVRSQSSYHVGEVVAYQNHELHTMVLHRIIGREGDRYIFKGDNNDFVDPEHPLASQLIGSLWIHIPGAGVRLQSIRSPTVMGGLIFVGILLLTGGAFTQRRRQRHRQRRAGGSIMDSSPQLPQRPRGPVVTVLTIGLLALLPFLALALLAFTRPLTTSHVVKIPYKQSGKLSYSADEAPGPAYPAGRASTGEPLFTNVLPAVGVRFDYQFESATKHAVAGKASLSAKITSTSGWHTTLALGAPTHFRGDHALVTGTLDLGSLVALMQSVETTTKVRGIYALTITPHVNADGRVGHAPLKATFAPEIKFSVVEGEIKPEGTAESSGATGSAGKGSSSGSRSSAPNQFAPSSSGSVTGSQQEPTSLPLGIVRPSDATMRAVALGAIAIILGVLLATLALLRARVVRFAPRQRDERASILARYRHLIVPVARVWPQAGVPVIEVSDMEALVRIAEHYERSILHETAADGEAFWVSDESGHFRYTVRPSVSEANQAVESAGAQDDASDGSTWAAGIAPDAGAHTQDPVYEPPTLVHDIVTDAPASPQDDPLLAQGAPIDAADWLEQGQSLEPRTSGLLNHVSAEEIELGGMSTESATSTWAVPDDPDAFVQEGMDRRRTDEDVDVSLWRRSGETRAASAWRRTDDDSDVNLWRQASAPVDASPEPTAPSGACFTGLEWTTNS
jgi:signal peptidase I